MKILGWEVLLDDNNQVLGVYSKIDGSLKHVYKQMGNSSYTNIHPCCPETVRYQLKKETSIIR